MIIGFGDISVSLLTIVSYRRGNVFREKNDFVAKKPTVFHEVPFSKSSVDEQFLPTFLIALKNSSIKQYAIRMFLLLLSTFDFVPVR